MWVYTCCLLLVSPYLYRYVLCFYFFLICCFLCGSAQHHPEGMETSHLGRPKSTTVNSKIYTHKTAYTQHFMSTHSYAHTDSKHTEELQWAANQEGKPGENGPLPRIPVTTSIYGTHWMGKLIVSVHMSLFVYLCVQE